MSDNDDLIAQRWRDVRMAIINKKQFPAAFERMYIGGLNDGKEGEPKHFRRSIGVNDKRTKTYFSLSSPLQGIGLTKREVQVLYLSCNGCTNKVSADCMKLSERTTEYYVNNIRRKTNTKNKAELIQQVVQTDFLKRVDNEKLFVDE